MSLIKIILMLLVTLLIITKLQDDNIFVKNEGVVQPEKIVQNVIVEPEVSDPEERYLDLTTEQPTIVPMEHRPDNIQTAETKCGYNLAEKSKYGFMEGYDLAERGFNHPPDGIRHCESKDSEYYSCGKYNERLTSKDLLPLKHENTWTKVNPSAVTNDLKSHNFLLSKHHFGIDTVGQSLKNANLQLRSEPPNPQNTVSPWLQSSIDNREYFRRPLEIGSQYESCS